MSANTTHSISVGAYLGNPNGSDPAAEADFEANYNSFVSTMGTAPQYLDVYVDYTKPISEWVSNASWQAWSNAQSPDAAGLIPVIGLPMASTAAGSASADQQFQEFAAGDYDNVLQGIVQAYVAQGFTNLVFRPGWEMNLTGPTYAGDDAQSQADWVAAFQHIYTVLHAAAASDGATAQVIWNPAATNYSNAEATTNLYPGDAYVDAIGADMYANMYPYSDGGTSPTYHDWATGGEDTSVAQLIANPINREHYWTYPAATEWSNDGSDGHSQSFDSLLQFAEAHDKPFAVPETGAGNSDGGADVADDAAFPQWLSQQLTTAQAQGENVEFVNIWDINADGNYEFSKASDDKPQEAAAWAAAFGNTASAELACFCSGTRIMTVRGAVPVEDLAVGDRVVTASGIAQRIRWIGWRRADALHHPARVAARPVRIRAGAFGVDASGAALPSRDLLISQEHAIFIDGVLIPARHLLGCAGIALDTVLDRTTYFHIELTRHDIVLAEGLACESWLDTGNRGMFENAQTGSGEIADPTAAQVAWDKHACAPLLTGGPDLDAIRTKLGAPPVQDITIERAGSHVIDVAPGVGGVRLLSASDYSPGDARLLGVAVSEIVFDGVPIELHDDRLGAGFHTVEGGWRWTDGTAHFATGVCDRPRTLTLGICAEIRACVANAAA